MAVPCGYSGNELPLSKVLELLLNFEAEFKCSATSETERGRMLLFSASGNVKGKGTRCVTQLHQL